MENKYIRAPRPDHPDRCQAVVKNGQCPYMSTENSKFCPMHCGPHNEAIEERKKIRNYRAQIWQGRINEFADNEEVKSLREEIGITRMMLENILNLCPDQHSLYMNYNKISDLVIKIEKLVVSCHKLEESTGQLLDKNTAMNFAGKMVEIISKYIVNPEDVKKISDEMMFTLATLKRKDEDET